MRLVAPCKECKEHRQNCHAICEIYKEWKAEDDKRKEEFKKKKRETGDYIAYAQQTMRNMQKRRKKKYEY